MALGLIDTGTISVAPAATSVTGTGVYWGNVKEFDLLVAGGAIEVIDGPAAGPSYNTLPIKGTWEGPTLVDSTYKIILLPADWATTSHRAREVLDYVSRNDFFHMIAPSEEPAPGLGENGQWALRPNDVTFWEKVAGVWVLKDSLVGLSDAVSDLEARTITGAGLIEGGGTLEANRTLTVTKATEPQAIAGAVDDVSATPLTVGQAIKHFQFSNEITSPAVLRSEFMRSKDMYWGGDCGVVGNGIANDTAAIRKLVQAVYDAGGGDANLSHGVHLIDDYISLPSGVRLRGRGQVPAWGSWMGVAGTQKTGTTIKWAGTHGASNVMIRWGTIPNGTSAVYGVGLFDLSLDGQAPYTTHPVDGTQVFSSVDTYGLYIVAAHDSIVRNVSFTRMGPSIILKPQANVWTANLGTSATAMTFSFLGGSAHISRTITTQAGLAISIGDTIRAFRTASDIVFVQGVVTAYSGTSLTFLENYNGGASVAATDWTIKKKTQKALFVNSVTFDDLRMFGGWCGMQLQGNGPDIGRDAGTAVGNNRGTNIIMWGQSYCGIEFMRWCDHNRLEQVWIEVNSMDGTGVYVNSGDPTNAAPLDMYPEGNGVAQNSVDGFIVMERQPTPGSAWAAGIGASIKGWNTHGSAFDFWGNLIGPPDLHPEYGFHGRVTSQGVPSRQTHDCLITGQVTGPITVGWTDLVPGAFYLWNPQDWIFPSTTLTGYLQEHQVKFLRGSIRKFEWIVRWNPNATTTGVQLVDPDYGPNQPLTPAIFPGSVGIRTDKRDISSYIFDTTKVPGGKNWIFPYDHEMKIQTYGSGTVGPQIIKSIFRIHLNGPR